MYNGYGPNETIASVMKLPYSVFALRYNHHAHVVERVNKSIQESKAKGRRKSKKVR